jgi:hypothetical protein
LEVKYKFGNREQPFDFENELLFFIDLIMCKIPFSFIRFEDGENSIMKGYKYNTQQIIVIRILEIKNFKIFN